MKQLKTIAAIIGHDNFEVISSTSLVNSAIVVEVQIIGGDDVLAAGKAATYRAALDLAVEELEETFEKTDTTTVDDVFAALSDVQARASAAGVTHQSLFAEILAKNPQLTVPQVLVEAESQLVQRFLLA